MENVKFLVIAPYAWGRGPDIKTAHENARKAAVKNRRDFAKLQRILYSVPEDLEDCYVDDGGGLCWKHPEGSESKSRPIKLGDLP